MLINNCLRQNWQCIERPNTWHGNIQLSMSENRLWSYRSIPTYSRVWPWALLIDIANAGLLGNCLLLRSNGSPGSDGVNVILGKNTVLPTYFPVIIVASITRWPRDFKRKRVPFNKPRFGFKFLNNRTGAFFFKSSLFYYNFKSSNTPDQASGQTTPIQTQKAPRWNHQHTARTHAMGGFWVIKISCEASTVTSMKDNSLTSFSNIAILFNRCWMFVSILVFSEINDEILFLASDNICSCWTISCVVVDCNSWSSRFMSCVEFVINQTCIVARLLLMLCLTFSSFPITDLSDSVVGVLSSYSL